MLIKKFEKHLMVVHPDISNQIFINVDAFLLWLTFVEFYVMMELLSDSVNLHPTQLLPWLFGNEGESILEHQFIIRHLIIVRLIKFEYNILQVPFI